MDYNKYKNSIGAQGRDSRMDRTGRSNSNGRDNRSKQGGRSNQANRGKQDDRAGWGNQAGHVGLADAYKGEDDFFMTKGPPRDIRPEIKKLSVDIIKNSRWGKESIVDILKKNPDPPIIVKEPIVYGKQKNRTLLTQHYSHRGIRRDVSGQITGIPDKYRDMDNDEYICEDDIESADVMSDTEADDFDPASSLDYCGCAEDGHDSFCELGLDKYEY